MRLSIAVGGIAALLLGVGCSSTDSRCSVANCEVLANCEEALPGQILAGEAVACGGLQATSQVPTYCAMACQANGDGAIVECIASKFGNGCPAKDGGLPAYFAEIEAACPGNAPAACGQNCMTCSDSCTSTRGTCSHSCLDAGACLDCVYQCAQAEVACYNACPTN